MLLFGDFIPMSTNISDKRPTHFRCPPGWIEPGKKPVGLYRAPSPSENSQTEVTFPTISLRGHINFLTTVCGTFFEKSAFGAIMVFLNVWTSFLFNPLLFFDEHLLESLEIF